MVYLYQRDQPIDLWYAWTTQEQIVRNIIDDSPFGEDGINRIISLLLCGFGNAYQMGWGGDIKAGPYFSVLPSNYDWDDLPLVIGWQENNNGTTYLVSEIQFPSPEKYARTLVVNNQYCGIDFLKHHNIKCENIKDLRIFYTHMLQN